VPRLSSLQLDILSCISAALSEDEIITKLELKPAAFRRELSELLETIGTLDNQGRLEVAEHVAQRQLEAIQQELEARTPQRKQPKQTAKKKK